MAEVPEGVREASSSFRVPGAPSFWVEGACFDQDWPDLRPTRQPLKNPEEEAYYSEYALSVGMPVLLLLTLADALSIPNSIIKDFDKAFPVFEWSICQ